MREIKFRCWDNRTEKFNYFDLTNIMGNLPSDCINNVQQYTGIKDKHDVEIFEGDIIKFLVDEYPYPMWQVSKVVQDDISGLYVTERSSGYDGYISGYYSADYEIIGNMFEDSVLLID